MFEDGKIFAELNLVEIAENYRSKKGDVDNPNVIKVPGFQRNAVWSETKVEALWDSLLCRFPIGAILLARYNDFSDVGTRVAQPARATPQPDTVIDNKGDGFIVVDGQQRLNAISVGLVPYSQENAFRLWVDLGTPTNRNGQAIYPNRIFYFFLCTKDNPFGAELTKAEKAAAIESIGESGLDDSELSLDKTYPFKAKSPVPFYEFCQILKNANGTPDKKIILDNLASANLGVTTGMVEILKKKFNSIIDITQLIAAIQDVVLTDPGYQIPAILIQKSGNFMTPKMLGRLFERVNLGGVQPPQAEIFYSALKLRAPVINNYVAEIHNDKELGKLLKPTDIILTAFRTVDPTILELRLERFENDFKNNKNALLGLMEQKKDEAHSDFYETMKFAYQALHHNGKVGDIGLPRQLLLKLRQRVWHTVAWWVYQNLADIRRNNGVNELNRLNIIRYAMIDSLSYFFVWKTYNKQQGDIRQHRRDEIARKSIDSLKNHTDFALEQILSNIEEGNFEVMFSLLRPNHFKAKIRNESAPDVPENFSLSNEDALLMFAQRDYLQKWEGFDLEVDHIAPSRWMFFKAGPTPVKHFWRVENVEYWQRYNPQNRTGNKRYWPEALNAGDRDKPPAEKLVKVNNVTKKYSLDTEEKIREASFIQEDLLKAWSSLSESLKVEKDHRIWTSERFSVFKQLVDERRYRIYQHFYETLKLHELANVMKE